MAQCETVSYALHTEGWFKLAIRASELVTGGQFGDQLKWSLESRETNPETGEHFLLTYWTSTKASAKSKLGLLCEASGFGMPDAGEAFDSDELLGLMVEGRVEHVERNGATFSNVVEVRKPKLRKTAPAAEGTQGKDPFADES